jgi:uncharacterized protein YndB with AHSA1/START domain
MPAAGTRTQAIALRLTRRFAVPREQVFDAWTTPEALKRWWCPPGWLPERIVVDLRPGGTYCFAMRKADTKALVSIEGRFVDVRRPDRLVYTWNWNGAFDGMPETVVTVEFHAVASGTDVVVTHENFPDVRLWHKHRSGWIDACDRMERTLIGN